MAVTPLYTIITPSAGKRPNALGYAIDSVYKAMSYASLTERDVEMLVGYDGVHGEAVRSYPFVRYFKLPRDGNFGNGLRHTLLKAAKGSRILFLDDDNAFTPQVFAVHGRYPDSEMVIARIDVSKAFSCPFLPQIIEGRELVRPTNIDPLCLCLSKDLVLARCGGWNIYEGYESDYKNIVRYYRRAHNVELTDDVVGIYDAGRGMDPQGLNRRQILRESNER